MKLVLVGGFLGSGKTTAIVRAARSLISAEKKVAIITNDQGDQHVDSAYVRSRNIPVREVPNGCFCCNYQQLDTHIEDLKKTSPDIIFAESVGTCTDLIATIAKPMGRFRPETQVVISIFADAALVTAVIEGRSTFTEESVRYIYKKQLQEADILILNKIDLLDSDQKNILDTVISAEFPNKVVLHQNSFDQHDLARWIDSVDMFAESGQRKSLDIDYDVYGEGEGRLAWLDQTIKIFAEDHNAFFFAERMISSIAHQLQLHHLPIGHLKFFLESNGMKEKISVTSTSRPTDIKLPDFKAADVTVLINARVQTEPRILAEIVQRALLEISNRYKCRIVEGPWSVFKPGFPRPTHRIMS